MKLFCRRYLPLILLIMIVALMFTLGAKKSGDKIPLSDVIISSSSDIVPSDSEIFVYLNDKYSNKINNINPDKYWSISPKLKGRLYKSGRNKIVFRPENGFKPGENYTFKLQLDKILNENRIDEFFLDIRIPLNEIIRFNYYTSFDGNTGQTLLKGNISVNGRVEREQLNAGVSLKSKSGLEYNIVWNGYSGRYWDFEIGPLDTKDITNEMQLEFDKDALSLRESSSQRIEVKEAKEFNLTSIYWEKLRLQNLMVLSFDCGLKKFQDLNGLISLEPKCNFTSTIRDDRIYLKGDFVPGVTYTVKLASSISNHYDVKMKDVENRKTTAPDLNELHEFSEQGSFLSSLSDNKVSVNLINIDKLHLEVKKIHKNNLSYFLDYNELSTNGNYYGYDNITYYGESIISKDIDLDIPRNSLVRVDLDLSDLSKENDGSIFVIEIKNPNEWQNKRKIVIKSDLAVTMFKSELETVISVREIESGFPIANAKVDILSEQHQLLKSAFTNEDGLITGLEIKEDPKYIIARNFEKMGLLLPYNMMWNTSTFDVGGTSIAKGLLIHSYLDRSIYRPGETITLAAIVRDRNGDYPDELPLNISVYNAENKLIGEEVIKDSKKGFFFYRYKTSESDLTGSWRFKIVAGATEENIYFDLQTVIANRITVNVNTDKDIYSNDDDKIDINVKSDYLFGKPASDLEGMIKLKISSYIKSFKTWSDYTFYDKERKFTKSEQTLKIEKTDAEGYLKVNWNIPDYPALPSALNLIITGEVTESNRPVSTNKIVSYEKYNHYVGIKSDNYYLQQGKKQKYDIIYVDREGNPVSKEKLTVKVYYQEYNWWYNYNDSNISFKEDYNTSLVTEKTITSKSKPVTFSFTPEQKGKYLIEVTSANGHSASLERQTSWWQNESGSMRSEGLITLKSDKSVYKVGDKAKITFPAPENGQLFYTLSKDGKVLITKSEELKSKDNEGEIILDISSELMPNAYLSVSIIQPITVSKNDRPIRMFGVIPIKVEEESTRLSFDLKTPEKVKPGSKLTCEIQADTNTKIPFTLYVIDEGLVTLTEYRIPNPWNTFYAKRRLQTIPYDNYPWFIGLPQGDAFKTFSVGGSAMFAMEEAGAGRLMKDEVGNDELLQRFVPLSICKGVLETDAKGYAKVDFDIPNYQGAVRVIAVAANGHSYGMESGIVKVLDDLIVMPTLPRVMHPGDIAEIPVSVFAVNKSIKEVELKLDVEDGYEVIGDNSLSLPLVNNQANVTFKIKAQRTGNYNLNFSATKGNTSVNVSKVLPIISGSSLQLVEKQYKFNENTLVSIPLLRKDTLSYHRVELQFNDISTPNFLTYVDQLTRFPYGCTEQIISKSFPLIYIRDIFPENRRDFYNVEQQIDNTIKELSRRLMYDGSLSIWYNGSSNLFLSNYALHFLLEAENAGYYVPNTLKSNLIKYIQSSVSSIDLNNYPHYSCYGYYVLAKAGEANLGSMNYVKEEMIDRLATIDKWFLAAAYKLAGIDKTAKSISKNLDYEFFDASTEEYFSTTIRDKAIALNCLHELQDNREDDLYSNLIIHLEHKEYLSTNELSYSLMSIGQVLKDKHMNEKREGEITITDMTSNETFNFKFTDRMKVIDIPQSWSSKLQVEVEESLSDKIVMTVVENYKSIQIKQTNSENGLALQYNFFMEGVRIDPETIKAGDRFDVVVGIEAKQTVANKNYVISIPLPACWEPDQVGLINGNSFDYGRDITLAEDINGNETNSKKYILTEPTHKEIRDDRVLFFFDLYGSNPAFKVSLTAVTKGEFEMASVKALNMYYGNYNASKAGMKIICK